MIEKNLSNYDYIATYIFWEGTKRFEQKSKEEQAFLTNFFHKYHILVLTEPTYKRTDKLSRIKHILSQSVEFQSLKSVPITQLRTKVMDMFNSDLFILTNQKQNNIGQKFKIPPQKEISAMFGVKGPSGVPPELRKRVRDEAKLQQQELLEEERKELFVKPSNVKQVDQFQMFEILLGRIENMETRITRNITEAFAVQFEQLENSATIRETNTDLDGESGIETVKLKNLDKKLDKVIELSNGGQSWDNVALKDLPKWLKLKIVAGFKRLTLTTLLIPVYYGPKAIINATVIKPVKLAFSDYNKFLETVQRIWGHIIVGFFIAGVWVVVFSPNWEQERQEFYASFAQTVEYIPVDLLAPSKATVEILFKAMPGQEFIAEVLTVMRHFITSVPNYFLGWAKELFSSLLTHIQNTASDMMSNWWKTVKIW